MEALDQKHGTFQRIPLALIVLSTFNARRFEERMTPERQKKFEELVASVREKWIIQPIAVRPMVEGTEVRYQIVAGERRFRAAREVANERGNFDSETIPAMVFDLSDEEAFDIMATENLQREDLSPLEEAESFKAILHSGGNSLDALKALAKRVGIAPHALRLRVALLDLPRPVLDAWDQGQISIAHTEQFTRLADEQAILAALTECLRQRYTVTELANAISAQKPPMKTAKFDTAACAVCVSNSALQGNLFQTPTAEGVCLQVGCFKAKQGAFFTENWGQSKAKEIFGTNSFRFKDDLTAAAFRVVTAEAPQRCQECPEFVSIVNVTGGIVKGQERACVGANSCFYELFCKPAPAPAPAKRTASAPAKVKPTRETEDGGNGGEGEGPDLDGGTGTEATGGAANTGSSSQDDEKKSLRRGETFREKHYKTALPAAIRALPANQPAAVRLYLVALALESSSAREALGQKLGIDRYSVSNKDQIVAKVFALPQEELLPTLLEMALHPIMQDASFNAVSSPAIRDLAAQHLGIDFKAGWVITDEYLQAMTKAEIVQMGEEKGVDLWKDEKVKAYKEEHHAKKGWMSLKKPEIIDCILKSGVDLTGRVPAEIHTKGRAA